MSVGGRHVLLCVTAGIAAYKTPELVRRLRRAGCDVEIIISGAAEEFVTPLTLGTLSGRRVWRQADFLGERGMEIPHIRLAEWADLILIAPCTADAISKLASGAGDGLIYAAVLASAAPVLIFPAMNSHMYDNRIVQDNLRKLREFGFRVVEPAAGELACGEEGRGRMPEPADIAEEALRALCLHDMDGAHVLVTAGPTREYLDPVRYISNPSSGKMGAAMARAAWRRGAEVRLILGPADESALPLHGLSVTRVTSALDMYDAVMENLDWAQYIVKAAAVGDYRAKEKHDRKVKREGRDEISIDLVQNPDIAAEAGRRKRADQVLIGFAAETNDVRENAESKLERKNLDFIVANDVAASGCGFACDTNTVRVIWRGGGREISGLKEDVASDVWQTVLDVMKK